MPTSTNDRHPVRRRPFGSPGDRMYQTGDVALIRDGGIEYLSRADDR